MPTVKVILAALGSALGLAAMIAIAVFAFKIKGELHTARTERAIADSVRMQGEIDALTTRVAAKDSIATRTSVLFSNARATASRVPIVTGGGKHADSVANAAVQACFQIGQNALTACQIARKTADSVPALRDSLNKIEQRLAGLRSPPRWTAAGLVGYTTPMNTPSFGIESDLRGPFSITLNARADAIPFYKPATRADSLAYGTGKWRASANVKIPFR